MAKKPHRRRRSRGWIGTFLSFFFGFLLVIVGYAYLTREKPLEVEVPHRVTRYTFVPATPSVLKTVRRPKIAIVIDALLHSYAEVLPSE